MCTEIHKLYDQTVCTSSSSAFFSLTETVDAWENRYLSRLLLPFQLEMKQSPVFASSSSHGAHKKEFSWKECFPYYWSKVLLIKHIQLVANINVAVRIYCSVAPIVTASSNDILKSSDRCGKLCDCKEKDSLADSGPKHFSLIYIDWEKRWVAELLFSQFVSRWECSVSMEWGEWRKEIIKDWKDGTEI